MVDEEKLSIDLPKWEMLPDIGLYMDQVIMLMERTFGAALPKGEITKSMVNNYVKVGLVPRPTGKKYDRAHLARLLMICVLKQALSMESISRMLGFLCEQSVEDGYLRFVGQVEAVEESVQRGQINLREQGEDVKQQALRAGIAAAVCTICAHRLLESMDGTKK